MATYRLYFMDPGGRIDRAADLEAEDDEAAIRLAAGHDAFAAIELWCGDRKICRLGPRAIPVAPIPSPNP